MESVPSHSLCDSVPSGVRGPSARDGGTPTVSLPWRPSTRHEQTSGPHTLRAGRQDPRGMVEGSETSPPLSPWGREQGEFGSSVRGTLRGDPFIVDTECTLTEVPSCCSFGILQGKKRLIEERSTH